SPSFYERTGGHLVCMQGAFDLCSSEIRLTWSDPANDSMLTGQGPFTTMQSQLFPQINFFARKDKDPVVRRMWRFGRYDSAFLDGIYAICPQAGLTTDASLQDITYTLAPATTSGPIRPAVRIPIPPDEPIIAVDYGLLPTQAFVLTASDGRLPGALWRVDLIDETVEQVASPPRPRAMATGRDGTVYVA